MPPDPGQFSTDVSGLPAGVPAGDIQLAPGDEFALRIAPVAKVVGGKSIRMLAYNGSIPGPTLRVQQGSEVLVHVANDGDMEGTVHWHGLRLENSYDGTTDTQQPIPIGGRFTYRLTFPDPGVYWYHPHIREDYNQEMGLYGNIIVEPSAADYWPPVHREVALTLDDLLLEADHIASFSRTESNYTAMGRFGTVLLVNGETDLSLQSQPGEVVRFYLTNTANTRVFNVGFRHARMKLVGGDSGRCEREEFVEGVIIAPSERAVVDVLFGTATEVRLEHRTPRKTYVIGSIHVSGSRARPSLDDAFETLRVSDEMRHARTEIERYLDAPPDKTLALVAEMDFGGIATEYVCPMHPDVKSARPDKCPQCGMKLLPAQLVRDAEGHGGHHHGQGHGHSTHDQGHGHHDPHGESEHDAHNTGQPTLDAAGIEWEDDMVAVNRLTTPANTRWKIVDRDTGAEGGDIDWRFRVGQRVKIRVINTMESDHPMHHPFHVHGAGRFLVLSRDGVTASNLMWKDTVLIRTGQTVDILLDVTNPGIWMAHCHIAEHHESGMMFRFQVEP